VKSLRKFFEDVGDVKLLCDSEANLPGVVSNRQMVRCTGTYHLLTSERAYRHAI